MKNNIRALPTFAHETNEQTIDHLEELLVRARKGEVVEIAVVYKDQKDAYHHLWSGCSNLMGMLAVTSRMQHMVQRRLDDGIVED